jgi:hypothetical protein
VTVLVGVTKLAVCRSTIISAERPTSTALAAMLIQSRMAVYQQTT